ncbi:hypothetical protein [Paenibacillus montanisoli]|uniref:RNase H type-1 domain-containing protein n=1 Tax=Paenibacillus montanisoli TaxID=2081970 RepID=A0A328U1Z9_9BACL|nr:hypothetical protein [Paenibacillus montanisoli]RAP76082.1 hypothetical protein DL346_11710 [Paenibacillus montanisoli]
MRPIDTTIDALTKQAYATPAVRASLVHSGMMSLYCDYSGSEQHLHGVACAVVFNRSVRVHANRLEHDYSLGSDYGELLAIRFSLELLANELANGRLQLSPAPRCAVIFTDCRSASRLLAKCDFADSSYANACNEIHILLERLKLAYPHFDVAIRYMHHRKAGNALHRMAHNAARACIGKQG